MALYALTSCTAPARLHTEHIQERFEHKECAMSKRLHDPRSLSIRLPVGVHYIVCATPWTPGHTVTRAPSLHGQTVCVVQLTVWNSLSLSPS